MKTIILALALAASFSAQAQQTIIINTAPQYAPWVDDRTPEQRRQEAREAQQAVDDMADRAFARAQRESDAMNEHICQQNPYLCNRWK